jgi:hypothetical protein
MPFIHGLIRRYYCMFLLCVPIPLIGPAGNTTRSVIWSIEAFLIAWFLICLCWLRTKDALADDIALVDCVSVVFH